MVLTHWTRLFVVALVLAAALSAGLGFAVDRLVRTTPAQRAYDRLARLPRTDVLARRDVEVSDRVRGALLDEVAAFDWTLLVPPTYTSCSGVDARLGDGRLARSLTSGTWEGDAIPKTAWPATFTALDHALGAAGFDSFDVLLDGPDEQTVSAADSTGTTLMFTLEPDSTTFSLQSKCNLLPAARRPPR